MNALNKQTLVALTNNSGSPASQGDVVILNSAADSSFVITSAAAQAAQIIGVVVEPNGIAALSRGMVAVAGYVDKINLINSACPGYSLGTSASPRLGTSHSTVQTGDFAQSLGTGTTPAGLLWGMPMQASAQPCAILRQQEANTTPGGTSTAGVQTRVLNTIVSDLSGIVVSLVANQFVLLPGTYIVHVEAPAMKTDRSQLSIYDTSSSSYLAYGIGNYNPAGGGGGFSSFLDGKIVAEAGHALEVRHQIQTGRNGDGLGVSNSFGTIEVFTTVVLWKVA